MVLVVGQSTVVRQAKSLGFGFVCVDLPELSDQMFAGVYYVESVDVET